MWKVCGAQYKPTSTGGNYIQGVLGKPTNIDPKMQTP